MEADMSLREVIETQTIWVLTSIIEYVEQIPECSGNIVHNVSGADHFFILEDHVIGIVQLTAHKGVYVRQRNGMASEMLMKLTVTAKQADELIQALTNKVVL